jgi:S-adenosylmethionine/arginine decarboxylase-like enzyme
MELILLSTIVIVILASILYIALDDFSIDYGPEGVSVLVLVLIVVIPLVIALIEAGQL